MDEFVLNAPAPTTQDGQLEIAADLAAIDKQLEKYVSRGAEATIRNPFHAPSYIRLRDPFLLSLRDYIEGRSTPVVEEIRQKLTTHDFWYVALGCDFDLAPGCRLHRASVTIAVQPDGMTVWDALPDKITQPSNVSRRATFSPSLGFAVKISPLIEVKPSLSLGESVTTTEYTRYDSELTAFGRRTARAGWHFSPTSARAVAGLYELFLVVCKPRDTPLEMTLQVTGEVEGLTDLGKVGTYPFSTIFRGTGKAIDHLTLTRGTALG